MPKRFQEEETDIRREGINQMAKMSVEEYRAKYEGWDESEALNTASSFQEYLGVTDEELSALAEESLNQETWYQEHCKWAKSVGLTP